jgi:hypothetical protein
MGAQLDMVAGINYKTNNVVFQFPPNSEMAGTGEALPSDSRKFFYVLHPSYCLRNKPYTHDN